MRESTDDNQKDVEMKKKSEELIWMMKNNVEIKKLIKTITKEDEYQEDGTQEDGTQKRETSLV